MENFILKAVKALVVDDDVAHRELALIYFEEIGCAVDFASDGQEAIEKLKADKYDICFMDWQMPVMNGIAATKIIREEISKELPIIVVTGPEMEGWQRGLCCCWIYRFYG